MKTFLAIWFGLSLIVIPWLIVVLMEQQDLIESQRNAIKTATRTSLEAIGRTAAAETKLRQCHEDRHLRVVRTGELQ